jgi:anti-sigma regulatory factor (Ser/Thr protein kinase)
MEFTRTFDPSLAAPAMARNSLADLAPGLSRDQLDDLRLIVSELVTNAVKHAGSRADERIRMTIELSPSRLRVEVTNRGRGFADRRTQASAQDSRGLLIVDQLADRWGTEFGSETKVWAELEAS